MASEQLRLNKERVYINGLPLPGILQSIDVSGNAERISSITLRYRLIGTLSRDASLHSQYGQLAQFSKRFDRAWGINMQNAVSDALNVDQSKSSNAWYESNPYILQITHPHLMARSIFFVKFVSLSSTEDPRGGVDNLSVTVLLKEHRPLRAYGEAMNADVSTTETSTEQEIQDMYDTWHKITSSMTSGEV